MLCAGLQQVKIIPYFAALIVGVSGIVNRTPTLYSGLLFKSKLKVTPCRRTEASGIFKRLRRTVATEIVKVRVT